MWAQVINMFLGLAVMVAPGFLDYGETASNNNFIVGPLVITFAMVAITDAGRNVRWFNVIAGIWLIACPFILGFDGTPQIVNIILGVVIIILSFFKGKIKNKFGGGWRSLFQKNPEHIQAAKTMKSP